MDEKDKIIGSNKPDSLVAMIPEGTTEKLLVSKVLLCQTSEYFVKALDGEFKEAGEHTLRFPGWTSDVIELFIYWSYKWGLPELADQIEKAEDGDKRATACRIIMVLVKLWQFGEAHLIRRMQDCAMRSLLNLSRYEHTTAQILKLAYEGAPRDSALSRFAIDEARFEYFSDDEEHFTEEDLESLAQAPSFLSDFMLPIRKDLEDRERHIDTRKWLPGWTNDSQRYMIYIE